ncbi:hypothetical protein BJ165DRAFT_1529415 [Panaeolus papilionaceus]|nr:hypothetical protein BJ165DRAFT_1529415 [Panaeolus papilionaceus]
MAASGSAHVVLDDTIGIFEVGSAFAIFLFGIVTLQAHCYYTTFRDDGWMQKTMVGLLWLMELGHTIGVSYEVYRATITLHGQPHRLITFPALSSVIAIGGAITLCVQSFFSLRVYRVIRKPYAYVAFLCIAISSMRLVGGIVLSVAAVRSTSIDIYRVKWKWLIVLLLVSGTLVDVIITIAMLYYLCSARSRAMTRTAHIIDKLIVYTLRSGLLTSLSAIVLLVLFLTKPKTMSWLAVYTFLAKLYSNSLLSVLNGRAELRYDSDGLGHESMERFGTTPGRGDATTTQLAPRIDVIELQLKKTTDTSRGDVDDKIDSKPSDEAL